MNYHVIYVNVGRNYRLPLNNRRTAAYQCRSGIARPLLCYWHGVWFV